MLTSQAIRNGATSFYTIISQCSVQSTAIVVVSWLMRHQQQLLALLSLLLRNSLSISLLLLLRNTLRNRLRTGQSPILRNTKCSIVTFVGLSVYWSVRIVGHLWTSVWLTTVWLFELWSTSLLKQRNHIIHHSLLLSSQFKTILNYIMQPLSWPYIASLWRWHV